MGGQNHQPTREITTSPSAWLSQKVGEGFVRVLEANNRLEDAIMLGMKKAYVSDVTDHLEGPAAAYLRQSITLLEQSLKILPQIEGGFERLLNAATREGYTGNPLASQLPALNLEANFEGNLVRPYSQARLWKELEGRISRDNILDTLRWEKAQFSELTQPTENLIHVMRSCLAICERQSDKAFVDVVEHNEVPLRQYYAQVFSLWNHLHAMFLYSALMMTELFYRASGYPSLLEFDPENKGVRVA